MTDRCLVRAHIASRARADAKLADVPSKHLLDATAGHNPDPEYTSFSCRIPSSMRKLPESERPNLIELLKEFGELVGPA